MTSMGPEIAQAGATNTNDTHVRNTFGSRPVEYWVNDGGKPPSPKPEPKPHPKPEPKPHPKPEPKPHPKPEPKPTPGDGLVKKLNEVLAGTPLAGLGKLLAAELRKDHVPADFALDVLGKLF